jgi:hypothetical protein
MALVLRLPATMPTPTPIRVERFSTRHGDQVWLWQAHRLPARLRYRVVVHAWAVATVRPRQPEQASSLTVGELVGLLEDEPGMRCDAPRSGRPGNQALNPEGPRHRRVTRLTGRRSAGQAE